MMLTREHGRSGDARQRELRRQVELAAVEDAFAHEVEVGITPGNELVSRGRDATRRPPSPRTWANGIISRKKNANAYRLASSTCSALIAGRRAMTLFRSSCDSMSVVNPRPR